jgi:tRNA modification GTPase
VVQVLEDTIAAISTPIGAAGIGIVRVSGKNAVRIAETIFKSKKNTKIAEARSYAMLYGYIMDKHNKIIDEVLLSVMRGPNSFTAEDVVEIN